MKREYEFEEWEEEHKCFYVRVEAVFEDHCDRAIEYLIPLEVAEWVYMFPGTPSDSQEIGPAMSETEMKEWLTPEREKKILERIHDMAADAYDAWVEGHR